MDEPLQRITRIEAGLENIKDDTSEIKKSIEAFVAQTAKNAIEMEGLRGRIREGEHDIIAIKADIKTLKTDNATLKTSFAKLAVYVALGAGGATLTIDKILGLFK